jgi:hypothetical protein
VQREKKNQRSYRRLDDFAGHEMLVNIGDQKPSRVPGNSSFDRTSALFSKS